MQLARILAILTPCNAVEHTWPVPDPDLEIRGGPGHPDPYIRGEGGGPSLQKKFFGPSGFSVVLKKGGVAPPGPSPRSATYG